MNRWIRDRVRPARPANAPPVIHLPAAGEPVPGEGVDENTGCATLAFGFVVFVIVGAIGDELLHDADRMLRPLIFLALALIAGMAWWLVRRARARMRARQLGWPVPPWRGALLLAITIPCFLFLSYTAIHQDRVRTAAAMPKHWPTLERGGMRLSLMTRLAGDTLSYRVVIQCPPGGPCPPDEVSGLRFTLYGPDGMREEVWNFGLRRTRGNTAVLEGKGRMFIHSLSQYLAARCWDVQASPDLFVDSASSGCATMER